MGKKDATREYNSTVIYIFKTPVNILQDPENITDISSLIYYSRSLIKTENTFMSLLSFLQNNAGKQT